MWSALWCSSWDDSFWAGQLHFSAVSSIYRLDLKLCWDSVDVLIVHCNSLLSRYAEQYCIFATIPWRHTINRKRSWGYVLIWHLVYCWLPRQNPYNSVLTCSSTASYLFSPLGEHKVLGIGELWGTGMLLYLAWPGLRGPASCLASTHSHVWTQWDTYTLTAYKASVAAETWFNRVSNPSQQPAVLTNGTLGSSCQNKITLQTQTGFGGRLTYHSSPGIWLK